jgi:SAM-dependent methyltransferase
MSFDPNAHREASRRQWEGAAGGWIGRQELIREWGAPVSHWMLDAIRPQRGHRVLELAAGVAETGLLAAELVAPVGGVIVSDQAEAMLEGARARARELGLGNVEFRVLDAEAIDLPLASLDAVLCRWGYMLLADPAIALVETRRVLRPGGRVALAVWASVEHNPWASLTTVELIERGLISAPPPGTPGPFALGDPQRVRALLEEAGFQEAQVEAIDLQRRHASFEEFWQSQLDLSPSLPGAVLSRPAQEVAEIREGIAARLQPYTAADGSLTIPGRTLVAAASA